MINKKITKLFLTGAMAVSIATTATAAYANPDGQVINAYFDDYKIIINGNDKSSTPEDSRPFIYNDRTYVPLRYIGESLGKEVSWDGNTSTIYINESENTEESKEEVPVKTEEDSSTKAMLDSYSSIIANASSYDFGEYFSVNTNGEYGYRYALVKLQPEDTVPTLLVEQKTPDNVYFMRMFKYVPETQTICQPEESLMEGVAPTGGFRGVIQKAEDGNGIIYIDSGSRGDATYYRVSLNGDTIVKNVEWDGNLLKSTPNVSTVDIAWYDINDMSGFNDWTINGEKNIIVYFGDYNIIVNGEDKSNAPEDSKPFIYSDRTYVPLRYISELLGKEVSWDGSTLTIYINDGDGSNDIVAPEQPENPSAESEDEVQPITDSDRTVLTGTLGVYSYNEVLDLQGISDPNPGPWTDRNQNFYFREPLKIDSQS